MRMNSKRVFDLLLSVIGLLVLSPLLLMIAILVKLDSRGPVFFRQARVGLNGDQFRIIKFRTMVLDADKQGYQVTSGSDARITGLGRILRKYKLDELPQLINVLLGDMSFVGPRPEVPAYVTLYTPEQSRVLTVRPGITGLSQVEFRHEEDLLKDRADVEQFYITEVMPAKLRIDLRYLDSRTFAGDIRILLHTFMALCRRPKDTQPNLSLR